MEVKGEKELHIRAVAPSLYRAIRKEAEKQGLSMSAWIRLALANQLYEERNSDD